MENTEDKYSVTSAPPVKPEPYDPFATDKPKATGEPKANVSNAQPGQNATAATEGTYAPGDHHTGNDSVRGMEDNIRLLLREADKYKEEDEETRKLRERKEKSKKIIAAVTDGLSSLANLYYTTKGAPDMYDHRDSALGKTNAHIDKLKADREANREKFLQYSLKAGSMKNELDRLKREIAEENEKRKRDAELHPLLMALKEAEARKNDAMADKYGYEAETARTKSEFQPMLSQAELDLTGSKIKTEGAKQNAHNASARNSNASAASHNRSNQAEYRGMGADGKWHYFKNRQAAIDYERAENTYDGSRWEYDEETTETKEGKTKKRVNSKKPTSKYQNTSKQDI